MCTYVCTSFFFRLYCDDACDCVSYAMPTLNQNTIKLFRLQWKIYDNHIRTRTNNSNALKKGNLNISVECMLMLIQIWLVSLSLFSFVWLHSLIATFLPNFTPFHRLFTAFCLCCCCCLLCMRRKIEFVGSKM